MGEIKIIGDPEVSLKEACDEKYHEVEWTLNETPSSEWDREFEKEIKPKLETPGTLLGIYKPKIINNFLIVTTDSEKKIIKQKKYFETEFFSKINNKLYK